MNLLAKVSTIMTTGLITVGPEDTMKKVEDLFKKNRIHHLPVVENDKLIGMVSKSDYLFFKRGFNEQTKDSKMDMLRMKARRVKDVMTTRLAKLETSDKINVALEVFKENIFHALPITEDGKLVGLITTFDIINHLASDMSAINEYNLSNK